MPSPLRNAYYFLCNSLTTFNCAFHKPLNLASVEGRKMRVDTTVVEANIHYPTDSSLMGDGVRVLTRTMKKVTAIAGQVGATLRDRRRSVTRRLWEIGRIARGKGAQRQEKLTRAYQHLVASTSRVVGQAKRFSQEIAAGVNAPAMCCTRLRSRAYGRSWTPSCHACSRSSVKPARASSAGIRTWSTSCSASSSRARK